MLSILAADENTARRLSREKGLPDTAACMVAWRETGRRAMSCIQRKKGRFVCSMRRRIPHPCWTDC